MNTELIRKYAALASEIKKKEIELKETLEEVKENLDFYEIENQVLEEMMAEGQKTIPTEYGNVTVRETKTYEYPDYWTQEKESFALAKKELEKVLKMSGKYSINTSLQLAGKPKTLEVGPEPEKGRIH